MGNKHEVEEINCEQLIPKPDWLVQAQFLRGTLVTNVVKLTAKICTSVKQKRSKSSCTPLSLFTYFQVLQERSFKIFFKKFKGQIFSKNQINPMF